MPTKEESSKETRYNFVISPTFRANNFTYSSKINNVPYRVCKTSFFTHDELIYNVHNPTSNGEKKPSVMSRLVESPLDSEQYGKCKIFLSVRSCHNYTISFVIDCIKIYVCRWVIKIADLEIIWVLYLRQRAKLFNWNIVWHGLRGVGVKNAEISVACRTYSYTRVGHRQIINNH